MNQDSEINKIQDTRACKHIIRTPKSLMLPDEMHGNKDAAAGR